MARDTRRAAWALTDNQAIDTRLSPAEVHGILRQRLERLAGAWGLEPSDLHHLVRRAPVRTYAPGEIVVRRGARADCLGVVVRGQVAVYLGQSGAARLGIVLLAGSTFGEAMLLEGRPSPTTLQALGRCEIRFLLRSDLQARSQERRTERHAAALWRLVAVSGALLAVMLALVLALSLAPSRKALALVPLGLGQWCSQRGYAACVEQTWQAAANLAPDDANPQLALGTHYFQRGELAAAEQAFLAAVTLAPDLPEARNNLGLIYARQDKHREAIAAFQEALRLEPGIAAVEHNLGLSLLALQEYEDAAAHFQTALALAEPQASSLVNLAVAYYEAGHSTQAAEAAREALLYDESLAAAYTILGAVALEERQPREALTDLNRAIALDAGYERAYFYLGLAYKSLDRPDEAIAAFERALVGADDEVMRVRIRRHLNELYEAQKQSGTP